MIDPADIADATSIAVDVGSGLDPLVQAGLMELGLGGLFLFLLWLLLRREQNARDAVNRELIDILKLQPAAIGKLETAITGLSSEVSGLRRDHAAMQRGQEEIKTRVDTHATRLDDHERRIMAYEYSEPAAAAPRQRRPAQGSA